jgi:hypothetical protein
VASQHSGSHPLLLDYDDSGDEQADKQPEQQQQQAHGLGKRARSAEEDSDSETDNSLLSGRPASASLLTASPLWAELQATKDSRARGQLCLIAAGLFADLGRVPTRDEVNQRYQQSKQKNKEQQAAKRRAKQEEAKQANQAREQAIAKTPAQPRPVKPAAPPPPKSLKEKQGAARGAGVAVTATAAAIAAAAAEAHTPVPPEPAEARPQAQLIAQRVRNNLLAERVGEHDSKLEDHERQIQQLTSELCAAKCEKEHIVRQHGEEQRFLRSTIQRLEADVATARREFKAAYTEGFDAGFAKAQQAFQLPSPPQGHHGFSGRRH